MTGCWFAAHLGPEIGPCDGPLVMAHLLPKEKIRREFPRGAYRPAGGVAWHSMPRGDVDLRELARGGKFTPRDRILWDPRIIVMACGGPMGNGGHHGQFDSWALSVPREKLPRELLEWALEYGLGWMIDWRFGRDGIPHLAE